MTTTSSAALSGRLSTVRARVTEANLDALLVTHVPNLLYLTNFSGTTAAAIISADAVHFITDFRYLTATEALQASAGACPGLELHRVDQSYEAAIADVARAIGARRLGFEAGHLTVSRHRWLEHAFGEGADAVRLLATEGIVEAARAVKDDEEISTLREAARRLSAVAEGVLADLRPGMIETDVAQSLEVGMRRMGFARPAFDTIVATGANGALPHARAGTGVLTVGDLVVLDFGGVYNGYCVDLTRTVSIGPPSARARHLYDAVLRAQQAAIAAVRPGVATTSVDGAARRVLEEAGYGAAFGHGTGHGLGVEVHELPRLARPNREAETRVYPAGHVPDPGVIEPRMVFTIEPGAYLPGFGGVRIEDDVLVTDGGCEILTTVDRALRVC